MAHVILVIIEIVVCSAMIQALRKNRRLAKTPNATIDSNPSGPVRIKGKIKKKEKLLKSPYSNTKCVYYNITITQGTWSNDKSDKIIFENSKHVPFLIDDGTGEIEVNGTNAEFDLYLDKKNESGFFSDPDQKMRKIMKKCGIKDDGLLIKKELCMEEFYLEEGDKVFAMGYATGKDTKQLTSNKYPLLISDRPEDDIVMKMEGMFSGFLILLIFVISAHCYLALNNHI